MSEWISVEERMPDKEMQEYFEAHRDNSMEIICMIRGASIATVLEYDGKEFSWDGNDYTSEVTHWMPLPNPPEVQNG